MLQTIVSSQIAGAPGVRRLTGADFFSSHASLNEVARYTEAADRKQLAQSAMARVRTWIVKPEERFAQKR